MNFPLNICCASKESSTFFLLRDLVTRSKRLSPSSLASLSEITNAIPECGKNGLREGIYFQKKKEKRKLKE
ncbi:hypothetical protein SAMN04488511_11625 [Pedobacter suwonensis]|uniref:Uncharacterized protein n=1 Tax=Pedobacter suwonensis TaxID=332999 RepID=A0A1I0TXL2_9SPHI|nr:hypothetical protein SAMN04488511_11625 [Pedobacter suwonensis]